MRRSRIISVLIAMAMALGLYIWLDQARNDLVFTTRSIIGQIRKGGPEVADGLFVQRRYPVGDPETQSELFRRITHAMRAEAPERVRYSGNGRMEVVGGAVVPWREVEVTGKQGGRYTLRWVKRGGQWYLYDLRE